MSYLTVEATVLFLRGLLVSLVGLGFSREWSNVDSFLVYDDPSSPPVWSSFVEVNSLHMFVTWLVGRVPGVLAFICFAQIVELIVQRVSVAMVDQTIWPAPTHPQPRQSRSEVCLPQYFNLPAIRPALVCAEAPRDCSCPMAMTINDPSEDANFLVVMQHRSQQFSRHRLFSPSLKRIGSACFRAIFWCSTWAGDDLRSAPEATEDHGRHPWLMGKSTMSMHIKEHR